MRSVSQPIANSRREFADGISTRINELTESLRNLSDPVSTGRKDLALNVSKRISELTEMLNKVVVESRQRAPVQE